MSAQQSTVATESSERGAVEESSSKAEPNTVEIWEDIKAQTGFGSYLDYINAYAEWEDRSDLRLLWHWMKDQADYNPENGCTIIDVIAHEDRPPKMSTRCHSRSGLELLAALRRPPKHVRVQIVLWKMEDRISPKLLDTLGLGLRIDPQFFLAFIETIGARPGLKPFDNAVDTRPLRPSHIVIDHLVATFVHHYPIDKPAAPPIILIAGKIDVGLSAEYNHLHDLACVAAQRINDFPPFTYPSRHVKSALPRTIIRSSEHEWLHVYEGTFRVLAVNNPGITSCTAAIIAGVLMPLLQIKCFRIRAHFLRLRRRFLMLQAAMSRDNADQTLINGTSYNLHQERFWLRRSVEDSDDGMIQFEKYISGENVNYLHESSAYLRIKQETELIHDEARRLDAEVRDYLQLAVGDLALEESRKSIELSNQQIVEGKRGL